MALLASLCTMWVAQGSWLWRVWFIAMSRAADVALSSQQSALLPCQLAAAAKMAILHVSPYSSLRCELAHPDNAVKILVTIGLGFIPLLLCLQSFFVGLRINRRWNLKRGKLICEQYREEWKNEPILKFYSCPLQNCRRMKLNTEQVKSQLHTKFYRPRVTSSSPITGFCTTCLTVLLNAKALTHKSDKSSSMESKFFKASLALQGSAQISRDNRQVLKVMLIEGASHRVFWTTSINFKHLFGFSSLHWWHFRISC